MAIARDLTVNLRLINLACVFKSIIATKYSFSEGTLFEVDNTTRLDKIGIINPRVSVFEGVSIFL